MGYFLTTEPENAVPPNSCASPKTHVPDPRVSERGLRYLNTELGRWTSRDPAGEKSGTHLYGAMVNSPVRIVDMLGQYSIIFDGTPPPIIGLQGVTHKGAYFDKEPMDCPDGQAGFMMKMELSYAQIIIYLQIADANTLPHELKHVAHQDERIASVLGIPGQNKCECMPCYDALLGYASVAELYYQVLEQYKDYDLDCSTYGGMCAEKMQALQSLWQGAQTLSAKQAAVATACGQ